MKDCIARCRIEGPESIEGGVAFEFRFASDEAVFKGHFPQKPILPGVFQIEMARMAAEWAMGKRLAIARVEKSKFSRPIMPDETIRLEIRCESAGETIRAKAKLSVGGERAGETALELRRADS